MADPILRKVTCIETIDAIGQERVNGMLRDGWLLLATGIGAAGQTTLTFGLIEGDSNGN